jgi:hypothetical protein
LNNFNKLLGGKMKNILVTGGTTFVSKYVANYFKEKFVKKRGEQFSLSENSFIEMIHSKKCEK